MRHSHSHSHATAKQVPRRRCRFDDALSRGARADDGHVFVLTPLPGPSCPASKGPPGADAERPAGTARSPARATGKATARATGTATGTGAGDGGSSPPAVAVVVVAVGGGAGGGPWVGRAMLRDRPAFLIRRYAVAA